MSRYVRGMRIAASSSQVRRPWVAPRRRPINSRCSGVRTTKAIETGFRPYIPYAMLAAAYALDGKMDEAKSALAEARRLNPNLTVKWAIAHSPNVPRAFEGMRKAGMPEE